MRSYGCLTPSRIVAIPQMSLHYRYERAAAAPTALMLSVRQPTVPKVSSLQPKQHTEPLAHIGNDVGGSLRFERDVPRPPIEVLHVIGEDDP